MRAPTMVLGFSIAMLVGGCAGQVCDDESCESSEDPDALTGSTRDAEYRALRAFMALYPQGSTITRFGDARALAYRGSPDRTYYRMVCNTVAVAAAVSRHDPDNANVSRARIVDMLAYAFNEYFTAPLGDSPFGWGLGRESVGFLASAPGSSCALAAALTWDWMSPAQRSIARRALVDLATRIATEHTPAWYSGAGTCGDSKAEEAASDGSFLALMSQLDPGDPAAATWLVKARALFRWVYQGGEALGRGTCTSPTPGHANPYGVTNHDISPHPQYTLSVLMEGALAVMPFVARGENLYPSGAIDFLGDGVGALGVYRAALANIASDFSLTGTAWKASDPRVTDRYQDKRYLGRHGVSDWGFGADFQNGAFAAAALVDDFGGSADLTYRRLLTSQSRRPSMGYQPSIHASGCSAAPADRGTTDRPHGGWSWSPLPALCGSGSSGPLVPFFGASSALDVAGQVNTHYFLNSHKALDHLIPYLFNRSSWPQRSDGRILPDLGG